LSIPLTSLKLPPITAMSYSTTRWKDWDNILTAHADETFARTWNMLQKKKGKHVFGLSTKSKARAVGSVKVTFHGSCITTGDPQVHIPGCLCIVLWELWLCKLFCWCYQYVEYAIGHATKMLRDRAMSTRCLERYPSFIRLQKDRPSVCKWTGDRCSKSHRSGKHVGWNNKCA